MSIRFCSLPLISKTIRFSQYSLLNKVSIDKEFYRGIKFPNSLYKQSRFLHVCLTNRKKLMKTDESNEGLNAFKESNSISQIRYTKPLQNFNNVESFIDASVLPSYREDKGDIQENHFITIATRKSKKQRTKQYARLIKDHLNMKRLNDAIAILEVRMLQEDRVKPENYIYNLLISGCAKAGYTSKAFHLYTKMRQRGLKVTGGTYTSLFNACANAPTKNDGLAKARQLRDNMIEKGYEPNLKNYNAMIKAYGRCGSVETAYMLVDEMLERQLRLDTDTFNFLLQACASDELNGFRHAIVTWKKMLQYGLSPDYYSFNTMLRCVRDCGFSDVASMQQVVSKTDSAKQLEMKNNDSELSSSKNQLSSTEFNAAILPNEQIHLPNLLLPCGKHDSLVVMDKVAKPHERFLLLGGLTGYLDLMKSYKITPDIKSFTTMLEVIPPTNAAEKQLLTFIRKIGLKVDIDFFNILIKKRAMRFDYDGSREVLSMIRTAGLNPDIVTYGVLAISCSTQDQARQLLQEMQSAGARINIIILGSMLNQGCAQKSFTYINEIIQISLEENMKPNVAFLRHLYNFHRGCARAIDARHPSTKTSAFKKGHSKFCDKYRIFCEEHGLTGLKFEDAVASLKERPYTQYTDSPETGLEALKLESINRRQKVRKYIKKIKISELRDDTSKKM